MRADQVWDIISFRGWRGMATGRGSVGCRAVRHHEETLENFTARRLRDADVLGVVVVGSVARGDERTDSDVDVYLVVTDEAYAAPTRAGADRLRQPRRRDLRGWIRRYQALLPGLPRSGRQRGDDPTRASFLGARVTLDRIGGLSATVGAITGCLTMSGGTGCGATRPRSPCTAATSCGRRTSGGTLPAAATPPYTRPRRGPGGARTPSPAVPRSEVPEQGRRRPARPPGLFLRGLVRCARRADADDRCRDDRRARRAGGIAAERGRVVVAVHRRQRARLARRHDPARVLVS